MASSWIYLGMSLGTTVLMVVMPMGYLLCLPAWLLVVGLAWSHERTQGRGCGFVSIHLLTTVAVVSGAFVAPVKTCQRVLDRTIELPSTRIMLADMDSERHPNTTRPWLPGYVYITLRPGSADRSIHFPSRRITLREFVQAVERQSDLRHSFGHCGNGYSILFGGDCCFGLRMR